jgi:propionyl-CoA carboxylase alpha chain
VTTFSSLLVANRGEIARRIFRTARSMGLHCVAVHVDADADAAFVTEADDAVRLPRDYLDIDGILEAARVSGAEAVHPGYGFLSENARFATAVQAAGLVWVGPPPSVIEVMGDKLAAKEHAIAAGVPTLPQFDDLSASAEFRYPILVKAAAGGGGKGMRIVESADDLADAVESAKREAASSFGDDRVFLERYVERSRHVEIQILGDAHGGLVHLGERECSIQRRHQKVIEESPSPVVDADLRDAMGEAALRLGKAIGYQSAGTVEFLLDADTLEFAFLEVNTRLQVEHPVTEMVTGFDLVREQLRVAAGERLGYGQAAFETRGHAIEARLYAEDPSAGFLPATGTLVAFSPAPEPAVRWDSGVESGSLVGVQFDPMLAKVIAHAPTRTEAAARLALALERLHLGGVTTNRDFLAATLRHPAFVAGDTTTDFIERVQPATSLQLSDVERDRALVAAALWVQGRNRHVASVLPTSVSGWRNGRMPPQQVILERDGERGLVEYASQRDGSFSVWLGRDVEAGDDTEPAGAELVGTERSARVHRWAPDAIDLELDGRRRVHQVTAAGDRLFVQVARGTVDVTVVPRFSRPQSADPAGALVAPMPGVVIDVRVAVDQAVTTGEILVVLEAMKMEHYLRAPGDGVVRELRVAVGDQVTMGMLVLVLEGPDEPSAGADG